MSDAYEQPEDVCNNKLSQLHLDDFPGSVKAMKLSNFIGVAYTLAERWDVASVDAGATKTKDRFNCCKVGARSMGAIHLFPGVKEAKKIKKAKNLKKVVRYLLFVLEKLEEKYADFYTRRTWPKASVKPKAPVSAPAPVAAPLDLPECAFGPDAIPGQASSGMMEHSPTVRNSSANTTVPEEAKPTETPVVVEEHKVPEDVASPPSNPPKSQPKAISVMFSWQNVNDGIAKFPRVLSKMKQLVARHVFQDKADIVPDTFTFNVRTEVDVDIVNDRLSKLLAKVLEQMDDDLDTGLQLSLHKIASKSRLVMSN